jgi:hypothetical protein
MIRRISLALAVLLLIGVWPAPAFADATFFWGSSSTPTKRTAKGFAVGVSLLVVGFEYEYNRTSEDELNAAPGVTSHMGNLLLQTPTGRGQLYFTAGGGVYDESYRTFDTKGFGTNLGGGLKLTLAGPIRLRVDYRIFSLHGQPLYGNTKRFYVGAVIAF